MSETLYEVQVEREKLVGRTASHNSLLRQKYLFWLLQVLDDVNARSAHMSTDWYLDALDKIQSKLKEF